MPILHRYVPVSLLEKIRESLESQAESYEYLSCSDMCDKTHEFQGCPSGTCALKDSRREINILIDRVTEIIGDEIGEATAQSTQPQFADFKMPDEYDLDVNGGAKSTMTENETETTEPTEPTTPVVPATDDTTEPLAAAAAGPNDEEEPAEDEGDDDEEDE